MTELDGTNYPRFLKEKTKLLGAACVSFSVNCLVDVPLFTSFKILFVKVTATIICNASSILTVQGVH